MSNIFKKTVSKTLPPVVLGADLKTLAIRAPWDGYLESASYAMAAAFTGADTNTRKIDVTNRTTGAGTANMASLQFNSGVNASAYVPKVITNNATPANLVFAKGDLISIDSTHIGTGIADPGGLFELVLVRGAVETPISYPLLQ